MKNSVQVYESACIRLKNRLWKIVFLNKQGKRGKKTRPYTFYTNFSCFWLKCHTQTNIHLQNSQHHQQPPKHRVFSRHSRLIFRLFFVVELTNKTTKHCRQQSQQRRIKKKCKFRVFCCCCNFIDENNSEGKLSYLNKSEICIENTLWSFYTQRS